MKWNSIYLVCTLQRDADLSGIRLLLLATFFGNTLHVSASQTFDPS